jgi:hypothetical protein
MLQKRILVATSSMMILTACGGGGSSTTDPVPAEETEIISDFATGVDGWKIEGDGQGSTGVIPNFSELNGVGNSGYIYAEDDVTGGVWYFVAPSKFYGDKTAFFNGKIEFYLIQDSAMSNQFFYEDIIIEGTSGQKIIYNFENYPTKEWTKYEINLNTDSQWLDEVGTPISDDMIKSILSDITKIMIRGEFESGSDTGGLDGFQFVKSAT